MPHKHKRKRDVGDSGFDLPPSVRAKPLPVIEPTRDFLEARKKPQVNSTKRRKKDNISNDTPKNFARLMAWHKDGQKLHKGLDNGEATKKSTSKKKKQPQVDAAKVQLADSQNNKSMVTIGAGSESESQPQLQPQILKIQPGETLAEFNVRVNHSLPLSSIPKNNQPRGKIPGVSDAPRLTKHNKRLERMQAEWRNTDAKLREKKEEEQENNEEKMEEEAILWSGIGKTGGKSSKKGNKTHDDDPWKDLQKKRAETKQKNVLDVVQAPPTLKKVKNVFKMNPNGLQQYDAAGPGYVGVDVKNVPALGKSLRRREELNETRKAIIEAYRNRSSAQRLPP